MLISTALDVYCSTFIVLMFSFPAADVTTTDGKSSIVVYFTVGLHSTLFSFLSP